MSKKAINRLKVMLVEKNLSRKWLAEKLTNNEAYVPSWFTNDINPISNTLLGISEILNIKVSDLQYDIQK